ncbi:MAG: hypothetical protein OJF58_002877 [Enhydrobacter sp.]|jgi:hypothetical protein|nr:MAG: hypothetical protein OJF58_002877 [Enhydrobacter sp.]
MSDSEIVRKLEQRLGPLHARQRLGIEMDHEAQAPAMATEAASTPPSGLTPTTGAPAAVTRSEATMPRNVLVGPNTGCPSGNITPPSTGVANREPKHLFARTGDLFAGVNNTIDCSIGTSSMRIPSRSPFM